MYRILTIILFVTIASVVWAVPDYCPTTVIAEELVSTTSAASADAFAGIGVLQGNFNRGEFIGARYYSESGALSNDFSEDRIDYYDVTSFPTVKFNGNLTVNGGGPNVADGKAYMTALQTKVYKASPIKIEILSFNSTTGAIHARVTMLSSTYSLSSQSFRFVLLQDDVNDDATNVVREVITQPITMNGLNSTLDFTATFTSLPPLSRLIFWAAAFVQLDDKQIIQAASTLTQPSYQIRAVMPFNPVIVDSANYNYTSPTIHFYNSGLAQDYTIKLLRDDTPDDWYLNYCSENGECYVGSYPNPFTLAAGDTVGFHLNLLIGGSGIGSFHFLVESANMEPYILPFIYQTPDTPNNDPSLPIPGIALLQNYPNPFSGETTLQVFAKQPAKSATIDIFNAKGQLVRSLNTGSLNKGLSQVTWNGLNTEGKRLPQGIYFSRINIAGNYHTQKMLMLNN
jgi:hypothetical protein